LAGAKQADGDGEIEAGAFLLDVGGREVDEQRVAGEGEAGVDHRPADAFDGFLHGGLGEAHDGSSGQAALGDIHFDFAGDGVDAGEDVGVDGGEHGRDVTGKGRGAAKIQCFAIAPW
jgi:hypothetical protein